MSTYPSKFGKYLLLERVNVGGMAEVFKAKTFGPAGFERILAVKRILPSLVEDEAFIRMFIDEARIAVQLNHSNIIQIYELGKHGEHYYIAMEYLPSRDMRAILDRMRVQGQLMSIPQAAYVISKLCEGLDYAHRRRDPAGNPMNIIHRDVSPQNILIGYEGDIKIIDFGIAKAANRDVKTQHGVLKGKFGYMSPEQVRGLPIDRRSDIFAVGVLLYEMLTGERLFICDSDYATLEKVRNAEVPPPTNYNKKISPELEQIVLRSLARDVEDRYQWASELAEDLQRFLIEGRSLYTAKRLADFMTETYVEDIAAERRKMEDFLRSSSGKSAPIEPEPAPFEEDKTFVIEASAAADRLFTQDQDQSTGIDDFSDEDDDEAKTEISPQMDFDEKTAALDPAALRDLASAETALPPPPFGSRTFESETEPHRPGVKGQIPSLPSMTNTSPTMPTDPVRAAMREELGPAEATATAYRPAASPGPTPGVRPAARPAPGSQPGIRPHAVTETTPRPQAPPAQTPPPQPQGLGPGPGEFSAPVPDGGKAPLPKGCVVGLIGGLVMSVLMLVGAAGGLYWYYTNQTGGPARVVLNSAEGAPPPNLQVFLDDAVVASALPTEVAIATGGAHTIKVTADGVEAWESELPGVQLGTQVQMQVRFVPREAGDDAANAPEPADPSEPPADKAASGKEATKVASKGDDGAKAEAAAKAKDAPTEEGDAAEPAAAVAGPKIAMLATGAGWRVSFTAIHRDERKSVTDAVVYLEGHELGGLPFEAELSPERSSARFVVRAPGFSDAELSFARPAEGSVGPVTVLMAPGESGGVPTKEPERVAVADTGAKAEAADTVAGDEQAPTDEDSATENQDEPAAADDPEPKEAERVASAEDGENVDKVEKAPKETHSATEPKSAKSSKATKSSKAAHKSSKPRAQSRKTKTASAEQSGTAKISVGARPTASVYIDKKLRGSTPLMGRKAPELSLGTHFMMLKDKRTGKTVKFKIELRKKGGMNKLIYDFEKGEIVHREGAMKVSKN